MKLFTKISKHPAWLFIAFTLITTVFYFSGLKTTVYQCDEYSYLQKSYFANLYLSGDFSSPDWQNGDAYDQTKLMEYLYALPSNWLFHQDFIRLAQAEGNQDNRSYEFYADWAKSYGQPANQLDVSPNLKQVLYFGRSISIIFTLGYILISSFIIYRLTRPSLLFTTLAFIFFSLQPIITIHGRQILADSALNFFLSLGLLNLIYWWEAFFSKSEKTQLFYLTITSGLIGGLAASAKLNGLLHLITATIVFALAGLIYRKRLKQLTYLLFLHTFIVLAVFILLHPMTWPHPIASMEKFFSWRSWVTDYYQDYFSQDSIPNIFAGLKLIFLRTAGYMPGIGSIGFIYENQFSSFPSVFYLFPNLVLFISGLVYLIKQRPLLPVLLWCLSTIAVVTFYLQLDWTRYYWPLFLPFAIINTFGLLSIIKLFKR